MTLHMVRNCLRDSHQVVCARKVRTSSVRTASGNGGIKTEGNKARTVPRQVASGGTRRENQKLNGAKSVHQDCIQFQKKRR